MVLHPDFPESPFAMLKPPALYPLGLSCAVRFNHHLTKRLVPLVVLEAKRLRDLLIGLRVK